MALNGSPKLTGITSMQTQKLPSSATSTLLQVEGRSLAYSIEV